MSKRQNAFWVVLQHSIGGAGIAAVPTPMAEVHKCIPLSMNELTMCVRIASIYADRTVSRDDVCKLLVEGGLTVGAGSGLAWAATQVGHTAINEFLNFIPVVGWITKGAVAGSLTVSVGLAFIALAEEFWGGSSQLQG